MNVDDGHRPEEDNPRSGKPASEATLGDLGLTPEDVPDLHDYWAGLLRGLSTEPVELPVLRGASGLDHELIAAGIDRDRRRLVGVSNEPDATGAAMAQADLQAAQNDVQVVLARAVIVNLGAVGEAIEEKIGRPIVLSEDLAALQQPDQEQVNEAIGQIFKPLAEQAFNARAVGSISFLQGFVQFIKQAAQADWAVGDRKDYLLNLSKLLSQPVIAEDAAVGVCPIPVYAFTEDELASIHAGSDSDEVRDILSRHNLFQYFFPAPDQTALGLIERAPKEVEIIDAVEVAPTIGHPLGSDELVPQSTTLPELLDQLRERDYVAQVDYGWELTEAGKEVRAHIRATPREGLVSKLLNRVSVKINLRSIFKIGP